MPTRNIGGDSTAGQAAPSIPFGFVGSLRSNWRGEACVVATAKIVASVCEHTQQLPCVWLYWWPKEGDGDALLLEPCECPDVPK